MEIIYPHEVKAEIQKFGLEEGRLCIVCHSIYIYISLLPNKNKSLYRLWEQRCQ